MCRERESKRVRKRERKKGVREREWKRKGEREGIIRNEGESEGNEREESIGQGCIHLAPPQVTPTCAIPNVGRHAYACGTNTRRTYRIYAHTRVLHLRRRASSTYTRTRVCAGRAGRCASARSEHAKPTPTTASTIRTHTSTTNAIDYRHHVESSRVWLLPRAPSVTTSPVRGIAQGAHFASLRVGLLGYTFP